MNYFFKIREIGIRHYQENDAKMIADWINDPKTNEHFVNYFPLTENKMRKVIKRMSESESEIGFVVHELENNLGEVVEAINNLRKFVEENETQIDLILPHSLKSWQYSRIQSFVRRLIEYIEYGEAKADDIHRILGVIMDIQHNLQKIVAVRAFAH